MGIPSSGNNRKLPAKMLHHLYLVGVILRKRSALTDVCCFKKCSQNLSPGVRRLKAISYWPRAQIFDTTARRCIL